jgi:cytochrome c-type biogenesis protein CcmH/NrfG
MTILLISAGLTFAVGLVILRPFPVAGGRPHVLADTTDDVRRRELLRQLRDLDDDLDAGKLTTADHARLRGPVEREAAAVLRRKAHRTADGAGTATVAATASGPARDRGTAGKASQDTGGKARRWRRRTAAALAVAAGAACVSVLLVHAISSRAPGHTITGDSAAGATQVAGSAGGGSAQASSSGSKAPTAAQLAAVGAAEAQVKQNPKNANAHLALADAFAAAGASQQAAVEYLAVLRLDPANAEANTSLALLAFEVGQAAQAKAMVDKVLATDPKYPEALYVRGLIDLMGLKQPKAADRDFSTYLSVAPFGSHRVAASTLRVLAQSQERR